MREPKCQYCRQSDPNGLVCDLCGECRGIIVARCGLIVGVKTMLDVKARRPRKKR